MEPLDHATIASRWRAFRREFELAKHYSDCDMLRAVMAGAVLRNPVVEHLLPSLLLVRGVGVLEQAIAAFNEQRQLSVPTNYASNLRGSISFLRDQRLVPNARAVLGVQERRDQLASSASTDYTWEQLDDDVVEVERALIALEMVKPAARYEFYGERSRPRDSAHPHVAALVDCRFGMKEDGKVVTEFHWTENAPWPE